MNNINNLKFDVGNDIVLDLELVGEIDEQSYVVRDLTLVDVISRGDSIKSLLDGLPLNYVEEYHKGAEITTTQLKNSSDTDVFWCHVEKHLEEFGYGLVINLNKEK